MRARADADDRGGAGSQTGLHVRRGVPHHHDPADVAEVERQHGGEHHVRPGSSAPRVRGTQAEIRETRPAELLEERVQAVPVVAGGQADPQARLAQRRDGLLRALHGNDPLGGQQLVEVALEVPDRLPCPVGVAREQLLEHSRLRLAQRVPDVVEHLPEPLRAGVDAETGHGALEGPLHDPVVVEHGPGHVQEGQLEIRRDAAVRCAHWAAPVPGGPQRPAPSSCPSMLRPGPAGR